MPCVACPALRAVRCAPCVACRALRAVRARRIFLTSVLWTTPSALPLSSPFLLSLTTMTIKLEGSFVAIVTPFKQEGREVDYEALDKLVEFQIANGTYPESQQHSFIESYQLLSITLIIHSSFPRLLFILLILYHIKSYFLHYNVTNIIPIYTSIKPHILFSPLVVPPFLFLLFPPPLPSPLISPFDNNQEMVLCQQGPQERRPPSLMRSTCRSSARWSGGSTSV